MAELIVRLMEEGVSLPTLARAADLPVEVLERLEVPGAQTPVPSEEELGQRAARLASKAIDEAERTLLSGGEAMKVRLILGLLQQPMRRMTTNLGEQQQRLEAMLDRVLSGGETLEDEEAWEDEIQEDQGGQA